MGMKMRKLPVLAQLLLLEMAPEVTTAPSMALMLRMPHAPSMTLILRMPHAPSMAPAPTTVLDLPMAPETVKSPETVARAEEKVDCEYLRRSRTSIWVP